MYVYVYTAERKQTVDTSTTSLPLVYHPQYDLPIWTFRAEAENMCRMHTYIHTYLHIYMQANNPLTVRALYPHPRTEYRVQSTFLYPHPSTHIQVLCTLPWFVISFLFFFRSQPAHTYSRNRFTSGSSRPLQAIGPPDRGLECFFFFFDARVIRLDWAEAEAELNQADVVLLVICLFATWITCRRPGTRRMDCLLDYCQPSRRRGWMDFNILVLVLCFVSNSVSMQVK